MIESSRQLSNCVRAPSGTQPNLQSRCSTGGTSRRRASIAGTLAAVAMATATDRVGGCRRRTGWCGALVREGGGPRREIFNYASHSTLMNGALGPGPALAFPTGASSVFIVWPGWTSPAFAGDGRANFVFYRGLERLYVVYYGVSYL